MDPVHRSPDEQQWPTPREWLLVLGIVAAAVVMVPRWWPRPDVVTATGADARLPYALGSDYWTWGARAAAVAERGDDVLVLGDSFVWGAYAAADHALPRLLGRTDGRAFANLGFQGAHPIALDGALRWHGDAIAGRTVLLHLNLLWLSSPRHDLSDDKEAAFNHAALAPQFDAALRVYRADLETRIGRAIDQRLPFAGWARHLQQAWLGGRDLASWSLAHPDRLWPEAPPDVAAAAAAAPAFAPEAWTARGLAVQDFDWVPLDRSVQWRAFQRAAERLLAAGNRLIVLIGPFNEHMLTERGRAVHAALRDGAAGWLRARGVPTLVPEVLPSELYADASHPLAAGYELLAQRLSIPQ
ncbi:MAG: hypothetical protein AB7O97_06790 [Planctomycetota bacterium]